MISSTTANGGYHVFATSITTTDKKLQDYTSSRTTQHPVRDVLKASQKLNKQDRHIVLTHHSVSKLAERQGERWRLPVSDCPAFSTPNTTRSRKTRHTNTHNSSTTVVCMCSARTRVSGKPERPKDAVTPPAFSCHPCRNVRSRSRAQFYSSDQNVPLR